MRGVAIKLRLYKSSSCTQKLIVIKKINGEQVGVGQNNIQCCVEDGRIQKNYHIQLILFSVLQMY